VRHARPGGSGRGDTAVAFGGWPQPKMTLPACGRLAKAFRTSPQFWLNGQLALDLYRASHDEEELRQLERIEPVAR
jgi:plasmid maintenance system antidote protein VapI